MNRFTSFLLLFSFGVLLSGCFKEENIILGGKHYYVSYTANGESVFAYSKISDTDPAWVGGFNYFQEEYNKYKTRVAVLRTDATFFSLFDIIIEDSEPLLTNTTYTFHIRPDDPDNLVYNESLSMMVKYHGNYYMSNVFNSIYLLNSRARLTITEVTPTSIRGTFSGNFFVKLNGGETVAIRDGEFYMPRTQ